MIIISCCHLAGGSGTKTDLVPGETQALTRRLLKSSGSLWTSPLAVVPLICLWVLHEWLLVAETLNTQGVYFLQLRSYSGQEKEPRSPQRVLCSPLEECLDPVDPLYNQNQDPETYEAGAGMAGAGRGVGGGSKPKCFHFLCGCGEKKVGASLGTPQYLCMYAVYIFRMIFFCRAAKEIQVFQDFLGLPVTVARKVTGWENKHQHFWNFYIFRDKVFKVFKQLHLAGLCTKANIIQLYWKISSIFEHMADYFMLFSLN